jgi:hypothetical protein
MVFESAASNASTGAACVLTLASQKPSFARAKAHASGLTVLYFPFSETCAL